MQNSICFRHVVIIAFVLTTSFLFAAEVPSVPQQVEDLQKAAQDNIANKDIPSFGAETAMEAKQAIFELMKSSSAEKTDQAITAFWKQYSNDPKLAEVLVHISDRWERCGQQQRADALRQQIIAQYPGTERASACQLRFLANSISNQIEFGNIPGANQSVDQMCATYAGHEYLPWAMMKISDKWMDKRHYDQALATWQRVADGDKSLLPVRQAQARLSVDKMAGSILRGSDAQAQALIASARESNKEEFAFLPRYLDDAGDCYFGNRQYTQAQRLYSFIAATCPEYGADLWVRRGIVKTLICQGDMVAAQAEIDKMLAKHSQHPNIITAISDIGEQYYEQAGKFTEAQQLYRAVAAQCPNHPDICRVQARIVGTCMEQKDQAGADVEMGKLLSRYAAPQNEKTIETEQDIVTAYLKMGAKEKADTRLKNLLDAYTGHPSLPLVLNNIGEAYRQYGYYADSIQIHESVLAKNPVEIEKYNANASIAKAKVRISGAADSLEVDAMIQKLIAEYKDTERLGFHIFQIGEEYYLMAEDAAKAGDPNQVQAGYQKALAIWQRLEQAVPNHNRPDYPYFSGIINRDLGRYEEAVVHFQRVISKWPDYEKAWHARYMIVDCVESLAKAGKMERARADTLKQTLYREIIQQNPNCPVVEIARKKVN